MLSVDAAGNPFDDVLQPMNRAESQVLQYHRGRLPLAWRWWLRQLGLLALSTVLLSLSLAPINLYFLAWVGLVPWIVLVTRGTSSKSAFAWGFLGGWVFFLVNMWWLWSVNVPGLVALTFYLAVFWGLAAIVIRRAILSPRPSILSILLIAVAWTGLEWLRGNVSFLGKQGLPWLFLGQTQSPLLIMCQIADVTSVLGVTFWVVIVNALVAVTLMNASQWQRMIPAMTTVAVILVAIGCYGAFRTSQKTTFPGPSVMVVQSNYRQSNTGEKGAPIDEIVRFHLSTTRRALQQCASRGQAVDLVVWSETMTPPINRSAREFARGTRPGEFWQRTYEEISDLAAEFKVAMLVGGLYQDDWSDRDGYLIAADRRNAAFFFDRTGTLSDQRQDKIHLVPFGEYIPFQSIPPIYNLFVRLGPHYYADYVLTRGQGTTVFSLEPGSAGASVRFIVPICFEDIVPSMVSRMLFAQGTKRADFLVNITNDGWFRAGQMPQHLQAALFRSIENRVPTARSVNTGVSGFVDSVGRVGTTIPAGTEGFAVAQLVLDRRVAPYTRLGDAFPVACVAITGAAIIVWIVRARRERRTTE